MNGSNVPESWEGMEGTVSSFGNLNVEAKPFVPSFARAAPPSPVPQMAPHAEPHVADSVVEATDIETKAVPEPVVKESNGASVDPTSVIKEKPEEPPKIEPVAPAPAAAAHISTDVLKKEDHLSVVFVGHVDAGKSTLGGQLMFLTGMVDKRTLEKYEREAKEKNRETWYLSWALDTNQEERDKGKTVEVGRAYFRTPTKHFTILDAPGHRSFVPNMIGGSSQADVAVLVISARRGEFETGFERGGQTREHAVLVKVSGVSHLIVLINKMDDPTVKWDQKRYDECKKKITPFLKKIGFNSDKNVHFMPCSGFTGANIKEGQPENHPWYTGPPLITYLDNLPTIERDISKPFRMPIVDRYKDMGVIVFGKVESGVVTKSQQLILQPNKRKVKVSAILNNDEEVDSAQAGENIKLRLDGIEEEEISKGFVLCPMDNICNASTKFIAQIMFIEYKSIIPAGFRAIMHLHSCVEQIEIEKFLKIVVKGGKREPMKQKFVKQDQTVIARLRIIGAGPACVETFNDFPKMARLALRHENTTIAIGKVLKVEE